MRVMIRAEVEDNVGMGWAFSVLLFVTVLAVFVPFSPNLPWNGLDGSWVLGMDQAVEQGLIFGKDIVFTFGPYASIYTKTFHPATDHFMLWGSLYLGLSFYVAAYFNFKHSNWIVKGLLLVVLASVIYSRDALFYYYSLLVGIYVFKLASFEVNLIDNTKLWRAYLLLLFSPFGLLPLIKGSTLIVCAAITFLSALLFANNRDWKTVLIITLTPIISLVLFWMAANQPLVALPLYFISMHPLISGYTEAMAIEGNYKEIFLYILGSTLLLCAVAIDAKARFFNRAVAVLMYFIVFFLAFKAGFVRHDGHAITSGTMIVLSALSAGAVASGVRIAIYIIPAALVWLYIDSIHIKTSTEKFLVNIYSTYSIAWEGLRSRVSDKRKLERDFVERIASINSREGLPLLDGTTDIYSYDQSQLISSGNKWNPRPIFQSYSAYTPELVAKNMEHLQGESRPDNLIFKMQPIDGRLPSLEDGSSWPIILSKYKPTSITNGYLFLNTREVKRGLTRASIYKNTHNQGELVNLPASSRPLFVEIDIKQTAIGRILNAVFKPSQLEIRITMENGAGKTYRLISGMAKTGFVISPHIESSEEFGLLYAGIEYLEDKVVETMSIAPKSFSWQWHNDYEIELFALNYEQVPQVVDLYNFTKPEEANETVEVSYATRCDGSIDYVNGISPSPSLVKTRHLLNVNGWLAKSAEKGILPERVYLTLSNLSNKRFFIETKPVSRPDVGAYYKNNHLDASGYRTSADVSRLKGEYKLGLAYLQDNSIYICPEFMIPVTLAEE